MTLYLLRLAEILDIDLTEAAAKKLEKNRLRYPVEAARGNSTKYTRLGEHIDRDDSD